MDSEIIQGLFENQVLLSETIDDTRQEIGEAAVQIGEDLDELMWIVYGDEYDDEY